MNKKSKQDIESHAFGQQSPGFMTDQIGNMSGQIENQDSIINEKGVEGKLSVSSHSEHMCWLCNEYPTKQDPFVTTCQCIGSNRIHASCLLRVTQEEIKKMRERNRVLEGKHEHVHKCCICKQEYQSKEIVSYRCSLEVTIRSLILLTIGTISLGASIVMAILCYFAFISTGDQKGIVSNFSQVYIGFTIFIAFLSIVFLLFFFLLGVFVFYKLLVKQAISEICLFSPTKNTAVHYLLNSQTGLFIYRPNQEDHSSGNIVDALSSYKDKKQVKQPPPQYMHCHNATVIPHVNCGTPPLSIAVQPVQNNIGILHLDSPPIF